MPRTQRLIIGDETAVYHVMSRTALDGFPLGDIEKLREINQIAIERCPGYYCISHAIIPQIDVKKS